MRQFSPKTGYKPSVRVLGLHISCTALLLAVLAAGCNRNQPQPGPKAPLGGSSSQKVIAQGQLMPKGGFIRLGATPGDIVEKVLVKVGDQVREGQILAVMRSLSLRQAQKVALEQQRSEAAREQQNAIEMAERQLQAAQLLKKQLQAQRESLSRKRDLLSLAESQVESAREILDKLQVISSDALTSEFVSELEVDRQRLSVSKAELEYQQQLEAHRQASEDLDWALQTAESNLESAKSLLQSALASEAIKILDKQLVALELEEAASQLVAPRDGVILAVAATKGEASIQRPLIEMADCTQMVCEVEINEMDAVLIETGQSATIRSRAFQTPLKGTVANKYDLVGRPQLRPLDPLARVDYRAVTAIISLDSASAELAKNWLQLQVEVEIETPPAP